MIASEDCEKIISEYYREIYNYCFAKLRYDHHAAEDCTQDVFVTFFSKHEKLDTTTNIRIWLYRTADNVIKAFLRKSQINTVSLDDELVQTIPDPSPPPQEEEETGLLDCLTEEERKLVQVYYSTDFGDKKQAAASLGMTLPALYQRIHKIKKKLKAAEENQNSEP